MCIREVDSQFLRVFGDASETRESLAEVGLCVDSYSVVEKLVIREKV
jgi:hypothetical protein